MDLDILVSFDGSPVNVKNVLLCVAKVVKNQWDSFNNTFYLLQFKFWIKDTYLDRIKQLT